MSNGDSEDLGATEVSVAHAYSLRRRGRLEAAQRLLDLLESEFGTSYAYEREQAILDLSRGRYWRAVVGLRRLAKQAGAVRRRIKVGTYALLVVRPRRAVVRLLNLIAVTHPDDVSVLRELARHEAWLEHAESAVSLYERVLFIDGEDADTLLELALGYVKLGSVDRARGILDSAVASNPYDTQLVRASAEFEASVDNVPRAVALYRSILVKNKDDVETILGLADAVRGELPGFALHLVNEALAVAPDDPTAHALASDLYRRIADYDSAFRHAEVALQMQPQSRTAKATRRSLVVFRAANFALSPLARQVKAGLNQWTTKGTVALDYCLAESPLSSTEKAELRFRIVRLVRRLSWLFALYWLATRVAVLGVLAVLVAVFVGVALQLPAQRPPLSIDVLLYVLPALSVPIAGFVVVWWRRQYGPISLRKTFRATATLAALGLGSVVLAQTLREGRSLPQSPGLISGVLSLSLFLAIVAGFTLLRLLTFGKGHFGSERGRRVM